MKTKGVVLLISLFCIVVSGCAFSPKTPVSGILYTSAKVGDDIGAAKFGTRVGISCAQSYFGLVGIGDASIATAAHKVGIRKISHVDTEVTSIFTFYTKVCTRVYGN